jgi:acyl dehydratase
MNNPVQLVSGMLTCSILNDVARKTDFKNVGYDDADGINLAQDRVTWLAVVDLVSDP